ncbi:related to TIM13-Translocase of the inner membrane [Sporisorium reilianum SRZ2]|uniref:Mitochondrial import inner membrane translocase subunit n=1 Tax=Sporisorium reilianum (strain SRZ2) TaxID=999809 RepID=E6ZLA0_SPORE|nr:related to TIM13-Translocase of the inner membrane [Sporisorium reilianum SRZ2]
MDLSSLTGKSAAGSGATSAERKEAIKQQVSSELAMANAQQLITKATEKCYLKCIPAPGASLSGKEQTCLTRCMERYFEAFNIVSSTYVRRVGNERTAGAVAEAGL